MAPVYSSPGQSASTSSTNGSLPVTEPDLKQKQHSYQQQDLTHEYPQPTTTQYNTTTPLLQSSTSSSSSSVNALDDTNHSNYNYVGNNYIKDGGNEECTSSCSSVEGSPVSGRSPLSLIRMIFMGMAMFGLECIWALEYVYATPILQGLDLPNFLVSYAWILSPFAAIFWSPIVGSWSDRTQTRMGKRRPFILVFCILVVISATGLTTSPSLYSNDGNSKLPYGLVVFIAISSMFVMDLSAKTVEGLSRALVVDCVPDSQIERANSIMTAFLCLGSCSGYIIGSLDLSKWLPHFLTGLSNLQCQYILTVLIFVPTVIITLISAREVNDLEETKEENITIDEYHTQENVEDSVNSITSDINSEEGMEIMDNNEQILHVNSPPNTILGSLWQMGKAVITMPRSITIISLQQLFSWGGLWVLWLFGTTWMGTAIYHGNPSKHSDNTNSALFNLNDTSSSHAEFERGVRLGSLAFALMAAVAGISAPVWSVCTRRIGTRYVMLIGVIVNIICLCAMIITGAGVMVPTTASHSTKINSILAVIALSLCGLPWSSLITAPYVVVASLVSPHEIGLFTAVVYSCTIISQLIVALTVGPAVTWIGHQSWIGDEAYSVALVVGGVGSAISVVFTLLSPNLKK